MNPANYGEHSFYFIWSTSPTILVILCFLGKCVKLIWKSWHCLLHLCCVGVHMPIQPAQVLLKISFSFLDIEGRKASFSGSFLTPRWWGGKSTELGVRWILVWIPTLPLCNFLTVVKSLNPRTLSIKWNGQKSLLLSESMKENVTNLSW